MKFEESTILDLVYVAYFYRGQYTESIVSPENITIASGLEYVSKTLDPLFLKKCVYTFSFRISVYSYIWGPVFVTFHTLTYCGLVAAYQYVVYSGMSSSFLTKRTTIVASGFGVIISSIISYRQFPVLDLPFCKKWKEFFVNCYTTCVAIDVVLVAWLLLYSQPPNARSPRPAVEEKPHLRN